MWILQRQGKPANPEEKEKDLQAQALSSNIFILSEMRGCTDLMTGSGCGFNKNKIKTREFLKKIA